MMLGLGTLGPDPNALANTSALDLYLAGLKSWASPGAAVSALGATVSSPGTAFSGAMLPAALGLWTPPLVLAFVAFNAMGKRRRR